MADERRESNLPSWMQAEDKRTEAEDWYHGQGGVVAAVLVGVMVLGVIYYVVTSLIGSL